MAGISGFSFVHNGIDGGYPFVESITAIKPFVDEMVVVDMQSDDGTRDVLKRLGVRILDGVWTPGTAGECLKTAHSMHIECKHDVIMHCEADEVFDPWLANEMASLYTLEGIDSISCYRLQLEQNFQRCRWYPELVHRMFRRDAGVVKNGHTTNSHWSSVQLPPSDGYLWDITNCFRDDWLGRVENQAELWGEEPKYRFVQHHMVYGTVETTRDVAEKFLTQPHWTWDASPFDLPPSLCLLVGVTSYRDHLVEVGLLDG